jgi:membrane carboxypeptidase/penicillin-binding protein
VIPSIRWRQPKTWKDWIALAILGALVFSCGLAVWWISRYAVAVHRLTRGVGDTVFYSADGRPWFRLDEQRRDVPLTAIAPDLQHAVVAIEDKRFYRHPGVDPLGLGRAIVHDLRSGGRVEGGSTLTQQLARTLFLSNTRTWGRKLKEATIAVMIEAELTKPEILELYLNRIYLSAGVYGVEAMSQHLYRKPARQLSLAEAALVAGLIRSPATLSPWKDYDAAIARSHVVLAEMRAQHFITAEQEQGARQARPRIAPYRSPRDTRAAWAKDFLRQQFRNEFGGDHPPDWQVHTSFVPALQDAAERAVADGVARLRRPGLQAALVAIDPRTGDLLALVGGANYAASTYNRAVRSKRQPGSAFKPFVYAAALARGYSPVSVLTGLDRVGAPQDPEWRPSAASHTTGDDPSADRTASTLRVALAESNNAAAVELQQRVGTRAVLHLASDAGLPDLPDVPSLALGSGVVTPLELTAAYTMFAGGGEVARPRSILDVVNAQGERVFERPVDRARVLSAPVAFQMVSLLRDVIDRGTATAVRTLGVAGPLAGKTGTTDGYTDAWFVGFSTSVVVGVWVGFDQPASIGADAYASRVAVPIWARFVQATGRMLPAREFDVPPGIAEHELCRVSHLRPLEGCPVYTEYFKDGDEIPARLCPIHTGSLRQVATRAVQGLLRGLGNRLAGLFRRK